MLANTILLQVVGAILGFAGYGIVVHKHDSKVLVAVGSLMIIVGVVLAVGAEFNLLINGSEQDKLNWLIWTK